MSGFKKATKEQAYVTMALEGVSGRGKTFTAQVIAQVLCPPGKRVYHIDSERGSASKYAHLFDFLVDDDFMVNGKLNYHPDIWIKKMQTAVAQGDCGVLILDTPTHMWKGEGGILAEIEKIKKEQAARGKKSDGFNAWQDGDKLYRRFMDTILSLPCHRIMTLRSKTKYEKKQNEKGYVEVQKLGLEPEYRDGYEFEVDIQAQMTDPDNTLVPLKHRLGPLLGDRVFPKAGEEFANIVKEWAATGSAPKSVRVPVAETASNDNAPPTETNPAPTPKQQLLTGLADAKTPADLKLVADLIKVAKADGVLTETEVSELGQAYSARSKALKGAA